ncbi:aromatic-L-amino-acid decarboxylase-like isoform X1 [Dermacentor silvarum]|uniref:aromatic-L-amino-acid decarboxylase-like isoform X1 n=1 Tax=Dermacentor silvarum TaxID=543639 RepID=UPI00189853ED|nr:aromatic-L-amino-acid decarboxylase-like isoform X1 [Dermacentor silvarum]
MSGQLVNWMHRVLPFSKNARSPQHCNAAYDHASSNASSRNASPLHCASSPARSRAAEEAASAGPEHPAPRHEIKNSLEAERGEDDSGVRAYEPCVAQMQEDEFPPPPPPVSSGEQRRHGPSSRGMDSVEFRQRGREMVEYIAQYMETIGDRRVTPQCEPGYLKELLPDKAPEQPEDWDKIMADVERFIMPGVTHWQHPHFHAYFPAGNSYPSILADMLSDGIGCVGFSWAASPACTELEVIMLDWIGKMINLPEEFLCLSGNSSGGGVIQSSASECILNTLLAARYATIKKLKEEQPFVDEGVLLSKLMAYCSKEAHSSVEKAAMIGFVKLRILDTDENFSLRGSMLAAAMEEDRKAGFVPFFVSATLGTTSCCSFDALAEIGPLCQKEGIWLHVDAAYAGSAFICPEFQYLHKGLEYAMSFNINPNKWMLVNFDCSLMWVKDRFKLTQALVVDPLYLQHSYSDKAIDYRHWGIPLSRRFRSLKLWFVVRRYGIAGLQHYIREHVRLAKKFELLVRSDSRFEVVSQVIFGLVCFRLKGSNQLNEKLLSSINASGKLHMVPASLNDRYVIRFCVCAPNACDADIVYAWHIVSQFTTELLQLLGHETDKKEEEKEAKICEESADEVFVLERKQHSLRYRRSFFVRMVSDPKLYNPKIVRALSGSTSSEPQQRGQPSESSGESPTYTGEVVTPL